MGAVPLSQRRGDLPHIVAPRLAWALVAVSSSEGVATTLTPVTTYAHLPPAARPPAFCPVCREPVIMKLGPRNRHHYAHAAEGAACAATTPEGALHLAAKLHLAQMLASPIPLRIARLCHRSPNDLAHPCRRSETLEWPVSWDEVAVEYSIPALRADLMLLRRGEPIAAIEVCSTHAVDAVRMGRYRELGLPWIEVPAGRITDLHRPLWTPASPLPVQADSGSEPYRCPRHAPLFAAWSEQERNGVHRLAMRIVHLYRTDGGITAGELKVERITLAVYERREEGECAEAWLVRDDTEAPLGPPLRTTDRELAMRELHGRFREWVRWTRRERGAQVDSPMRWIPAAALPAAGLETIFPERARWDPHTRTFLLPPNAPSLAWPVAAGEGAIPAITGGEECFWTALPERERPALTHGIVGPVWATLRIDRWQDEHGDQSRALIDLYRHDGARWLPWGASPYAIEQVAGYPWQEAFPRLVRALAAASGESPITNYELRAALGLGDRGNTVDGPWLPL